MVALIDLHLLVRHDYQTRSRQLGELRDGRTIDLRLGSHKSHSANRPYPQQWLAEVFPFPFFQRLLLTAHKVVTAFEKLGFVERFGEG